MPTRLIELVEHLPAAKIVLIGDLMLDRYIYGNAERLSNDAPVPVLHFQREENRLGGAGRVAADLATLGAKVHLVSICGGDQTGQQIRKSLADYGVNIDGVINTPDRPGIAKVRLVGLAQHRHPQHLIRLDFEDPSPIDSALAERVIAALETALDGAAALCIEDYNKGLLTPELCKRVIAIATSKNIPTFVDPYMLSDYSKYAGATAITPNRSEAEKATKLPCTTESCYQPLAERLLDEIGVEAVILTLDKDGAYLATREGERRWLKTRERKVYDVAGAGDMLLSMLAMARCAGGDWVESVALANVASGLEVEKYGSVPITPSEIKLELLTEQHEHLGKQRALDQLLPELARHRAAGKRIVFTNGCFDLIHLGHVKYFQFARAQGDLLVVGVNTDSSIRGLKGPKRPIISELDRLEVLEELESIDYLVRFDDQTPLRLIEAIKPDVLVKGADYQKEQVVGWDIVESNGGRVALAPLIDGRSTSNVIRRILDAYGADKT
ncbi:MAG: D-beta-D-heptose 7-phosphate kinase / D-beta-D-heptose 1-phosphate adenosyltransferase [Phycisphaerales bacterium]|jgi:D-beta-D-heptose 7-phosphate kinase/D-beta-D-heptose 1-phosphate adenosyltransferase|nr:D-beta-D-heptose 7-phosphate kinase / D-beta-D-heptose 1-phosphate adenosyltransferase [Phycisphaerales bacterium]